MWFTSGLLSPETINGNTQAVSESNSSSGIIIAVIYDFLESLVLAKKMVLDWLHFPSLT